MDQNPCTYLAGGSVSLGLSLFNTWNVGCLIYRGGRMRLHGCYARNPGFGAGKDRRLAGTCNRTR
ncbi:hypothetical protein BDV41DRAFT_543265 [Aspergillus transmontanensis]|uniref:Uncharacterized protein n=1 Tax=Aspergillus transmontanensis TaxID=1034304 RepID=A0A5N6VSU5_9EURO|nr:hypothetical protein BDV41DRAFT_543265 [Aspergillus transmontanensis]